MQGVLRRGGVVSRPESETTTATATANRTGIRFHRFLTCVECGRRFDVLDADDMGGWQYGHDCEVDE
jgi:Fe2+ or Zn2+ uptake regulation protein